MQVICYTLPAFANRSYDNEKTFLDINNLLDAFYFNDSSQLRR